MRKISTRFSVFRMTIASPVYKAIKMQDPEFANAYEEFEPEMKAIRAIVEERTSQSPDGAIKNEM